MNNQKIPTLVAHRGYMERYPENSWPGLKAALDAGACWLEFDIQMCADGTFILMHDADLARTAGIQRSVFEIGAEEVETISVHEPDRFGNKFYPLHISTLGDVLARLSDYPRVNYLVEIKEESLERWGLDVVVDRLLDKLDSHGNNSVLISFNHDALKYAKSKSDISVGLVLKQYDQEHEEYAGALNPDYLICNHRKLPQGRPPWAGPWEWMLYEVNTPAQALKCCALGIEYIETADIGSMLADPILATKACHHGV